MKTTQTNAVVTDRHGNTGNAVLVTRTRAQKPRLGWKVEVDVMVNGVKQAYGKANTMKQAVAAICEECKVEIAI